MSEKRVKFYPISSYQKNDNKSYKLLPFNFTHLDKNKYILTNLVGEYVILQREELSLLVNKKIPLDTPSYYNLIAKHFIYDQNSDVAINLLSLKYRTKKNFLSEFTSLHIFVVSLRCDHSCPYCQVSRQNVNTSCYDMTRETADRGIYFAFKSPSHSLKFEFQGGEPLLNFDLIKYIVLKTEEHNKIEISSLLLPLIWFLLMKKNLGSVMNIIF